MKHNYLPNGSLLYRVIMIFFLIPPILAGCTVPSPETPAAQSNMSVSAKPRQAALPSEAAQVPRLVDGNTALAIELYQTLFDREANLVYAPHSLSISLAMTYAGARGQTEKQMAETLHYDLPQPQLHPAFNALDQVLTQRGQDQLHIANALWGSQLSTYLEPFLDTLAGNYGAGIRLVDFGVSEQARKTINKWVDDETLGRISELLPSGSIQGDTDLVLTNAVYFKANWGQAFNAANTQEQAFTRLDGSRVSVPMMEGVFEIPYTQFGELQAIELPYEGGAFSMLILLPETEDFEATIKNLDTETIHTILEAMKDTSVQVSLPKFQFRSAIQMKDPLMVLGMVDAFDNADFSGMDGSYELYIDEVYHQAFINLDESGTEAAAGSAVVVTRKGISVPEATFKANHPFIFLIRDVESGAVLFLGHMLNSNQ